LDHAGPSPSRSLVPACQSRTRLITSATVSFLRMRSQPPPAPSSSIRQSAAIAPDSNSTKAAGALLLLVVSVLLLHDAASVAQGASRSARQIYVSDHARCCWRSYLDSLEMSRSRLRQIHVFIIKPHHLPILLTNHARRFDGHQIIVGGEVKGNVTTQRILN
jgi:hypothetical protein